MIRIRRGRRRDLARCKALNKALPRSGTVMWDKYLTRPERILLVASMGGDIAGFASARYWPWNRTSWIFQIAVDPSARRRGIGQRLMKEIERWSRRKGARALILETQPGNEQAVGFYQSLGFRISGYNDRYYTNAPQTGNDVAVFISKDLR